MKKKQLSQYIRLGSIALCIATLGALITLSYIKYKNPGFEEIKVPLYSYQSQGQINYEVFLKPNSIYDKKSLTEDQVYISNLVDSINTTYLYEFNGEREAEIQGYYVIHAVIEGYSGEGNKHTTLWKKEIPLLGKTSFKAKDKKLLIIKKIPLKLQEFNDIAMKIADESKIKAQTKVTTFMHVELSAKTNEGVIEKKLTSSMQIPLDRSYFQIIKTQNENKLEALEEVNRIQKPIDIKLLTLLGIGIAFAVTALIVLLFGTQSAEVDRFNQKLKQIFKRHGTRLVALNSEIAATSELQYKVRSIEDLVRVSDELGKPIVYKHSNNYKEMSKFWVIDKDRFYVFELEVKANGTQERGTGDWTILDDDNRTTQKTWTTL